MNDILANSAKIAVEYVLFDIPCVVRELPLKYRREQQLLSSLEFSYNFEKENKTLVLITDNYR